MPPRPHGGHRRRAAPRGRRRHQTMTRPRADTSPVHRSLRTPVLWGLVFGAIQAASPLGFWWLPAATVQARPEDLELARFCGHLTACAHRSRGRSSRADVTYPPEFRDEMVRAVLAGRTSEELAKVFAPTAQAIRNCVRLDGIPFSWPVV